MTFALPVLLLLISRARPSSLQERVLRESESATLSTSPARLTSDDRSGMWAHAVPGPEQGCLLVAHPLMFLSSQTYFSQSVIFIFGHGETGSVGLILNKPTQFKLGGVQGAEVLW